MLIRYRSDEVIGVIDREKVGSTSEKEVGVGGNTPVFNDFNALKHLNPDKLFVCNATLGGFISDDYREEIKNAIERRR
mgnify:FL=1